MSEQENEATSDAPATEGTPEAAAVVGDGTGSDALEPAEGGDDQPDTPDAGHVSSVTDLPEGAEVDPLTDAQPEPVVERETHDG